MLNASNALHRCLYSLLLLQYAFPLLSIQKTRCSSVALASLALEEEQVEDLELSAQRDAYDHVSTSATRSFN